MRILAVKSIIGTILPFSLFSEAPARLGRPRGGAAGRGEFLDSGKICFGHVGGRGIGIDLILHGTEGVVVVVVDWLLVLLQVVLFVAFR